MRLVLGTLLLLASGLVNAQTAPACWPFDLKGKVETVTSGVSERYNAVGYWSCETPDGVYSYGLMFNWGEALQVAATNALTKQQADTTYLANTSPLTAEEKTWLDARLPLYRARAYVASNGGNTTRAVFQLNPDGTRSAVAVPNMRVAIATECDPKVRVRGTLFYSVKGKTNADPAGPPVLGDVVAVCQVVAPLGLNKSNQLN